jgi:hypothetical protein
MFKSKITIPIMKFYFKIIIDLSILKIAIGIPFFNY